MDFITRRHAEALPKIYSDSLKLRFYKTFLTSNYRHLQNYSKEKLNMLVDKYVGNVSTFLGEWVWTTPDNLTLLVIIAVVLYIQNPLILLTNAVAITILMLVATRLSRQYALVERNYIKKSVVNESQSQNFILNLNTVQRLNLLDFFQSRYVQNMTGVWQEFKSLRKEHSRRWFIQLMVYNFIFTFSYGIYQVITNALPLGFLILLQWSYANLWGIVVHFIGVMVGLIQQKENTKLVTASFIKLQLLPQKGKGKFPEKWGSLNLKNISVQFKNKKCQGEYLIRDSDALETEIKPENINIINNSDPLFNLSVKDNILLGKSFDYKILNTLMW